MTEDSVQLTKEDDFTVTKVQDPSIINEGFEGPGYEEAWTETIDVSSALDDESEPPPDALPYSASYCLQAAIADEVTYVKELTGSGKPTGLSESNKEPKPVSEDEVNTLKDEVNKKYLR